MLSVSTIFALELSRSLSDAATRKKTAQVGIARFMIPSAD